MKIEEAKKLDDGVSGIIIEGKIIKTPKEPRDSEFGWSQMIILKDDTGEIGSWINIESAEDAYKVGQYIKVKGKVSKYVKGGKPGISLNNANVIDAIVQRGYGEEYAEEKDKEESVKNVSQAKPITQPNTQPISQPIKSEKDMDKVWEDKDLRIARECAIKAVTELVVAKIVSWEDSVFVIADKMVNYIYKGLNEITSEAITKESGGMVEEVSEKIEEQITEGAKTARIEQAREIVGKATKLTEPQKNMVEKIIKSRYIKKEEVENIGDLNVLTKDNASKYISYWFGDDAKLGERDKREITANEKKEKESPFVTKSEPIEKRDPKDNASLAKDLIIEKIQKLRKDNVLEDDAKFTKEFECNTRFELWSEKELTKLKEKLEIWKPSWVTEK